MGFNRDTYCIQAGSSIRQAIACIDLNRKGIALVVDEEGRLIETITDGDIRRAILAGWSLDTQVEEITKELKPRQYMKPISARDDIQASELVDLMQQKNVRQVPILDIDGRVTGLVAIEDLLPTETLPLRAVIMAGGRGTRLQPLTDHTPKPMLPVGNVPLIEKTITRLQESGINQVSISTHYMPEKISDYFGRGDDIGVEISYISEEQPLGTAGALSLLEMKPEPILVINGDIVTDIDFRSMLDFHKENNADLTVGVRHYEFRIPYGVMRTKGPLVEGIDEKPDISFLVNAGIYLIESEMQKFVPKNQRFDMTDLIEKTIGGEHTVVCFPIVEYWLDIGQQDDYIKARKDSEQRD